MNLLAYIKLYRWFMKGEWVYIRYHGAFYMNDGTNVTWSICKWVRPIDLTQYARSTYDVLHYENW